MQHDERLGQVEEVLREADEPLCQLDAEEAAAPARRTTVAPARWAVTTSPTVSATST